MTRQIDDATAAADRITYQVGQRVLWHSRDGYTPPEGEMGVVSAVFPDHGMVSLTLLAPDAPPEFGGLCSMCAHMADLTLLAGAGA